MALGRGQNRGNAVREKLPILTALRKQGLPVAGIHKTNDKGQYDASGKQGRNDPCNCGVAELQPHKSKRHQALYGPIRLRAEAAKAAAAAPATEA